MGIAVVKVAVVVVVVLMMINDEYTNSNNNSNAKNFINSNNCNLNFISTFVHV